MVTNQVGTVEVLSGGWEGTSLRKHINPELEVNSVNDSMCEEREMGEGWVRAEG